MAVGDVFRLAIAGISAYGDEVVNVQHFEQLASVSGDPAESLIADWQADVEATYLGIMSANANLRSLSVTQVRGGSLQAEYLYPAGTSGVITGDTLPPQNTAVVAWKTGLSGRTRRGRSYLPPTGESMQAQGVWIPGYITLADAYANATRQFGSDGSGGFNWQLTIWSRVAEISTLVTLHQVRATVKTQRRRAIGVGS